MHHFNAAFRPLARTSSINLEALQIRRQTAHGVGNVDGLFKGGMENSINIGDIVHVEMCLFPHGLFRLGMHYFSAQCSAELTFAAVGHLPLYVFIIM
jgi:hypothetical protein